MPPAVSLAADLPTRFAQLLARAAPREFVAALGGRQDAHGWQVTGCAELPNLAVGDDAFVVAPAAFAQAQAQLAAAGRPWLGFVHSHGALSPHPSAADRAQLWRGCLQLIVARGDGGLAVRAYRFAGDTCEVLPIAHAPAAEGA